ncbi:MAG: hypothetical protein ACJ8BW_12080, partial [Ktedonobacteraceae bacterium]
SAFRESVPPAETASLFSEPEDEEGRPVGSLLRPRMLNSSPCQFPWHHWDTHERLGSPSGWDGEDERVAGQRPCSLRQGGQKSRDTPGSFRVYFAFILANITRKRDD